jgi:Mlc titration factor MtfA (ptsG expression regulator)
MDNFEKFLIALWGLFFLFIFFQIFKYLRYVKHLQKLKKSPLPEKYKRYIINLPEFKKLTEKQKQILFYKIQRFLEEKEFIGVGLEITDEIKAVTAFYACLPTLAYIDFCYPSLKYIYIYPNPVILKQNKKGFVVSNEEMLISGEAVGEVVLLVWNEAKREIHHNEGRNVIIHEFAHELDFEEGMINGIPPIEKSKYMEWTKIMQKEFLRFRQKTLKNRFLGRYSLLDKYAATNPAEFFAVLSEYYFERPEILKKHFPDIYKELKNFYRLEL